MIGTDIKAAAKLLKENRNVAFPTETVYGLGGNAFSDSAVVSIFQIKNRPEFNPLIVHSYDIAELEKYIVFDDRAIALAKKFWPGPLTMVLPRKNNLISYVVSCGLDTIAVRIPKHETALKLLKECGLPVAAPSANKSGRISPTNARDAESEIGDLIPYVLDGGDCLVGVESTVISLAEKTPVILRCGAVTVEMLTEVLGEVKIAGGENTKISSPGMLKKHYSPCLKLEKDVTEPKKDYAFLGFGKMPFEVTLNLSEKGDLSEAAANLFKFMRQVDVPEKFKGILVAPIPDEGIGQAINDRLKRASY